MANESISKQFHESLARYLLQPSVPSSTINDYAFRSIFSSVGIEMPLPYQMEYYKRKVEEEILNGQV